MVTQTLNQCDFAQYMSTREAQKEFGSYTIGDKQKKIHRLLGDSTEVLLNPPQVSKAGITIKLGLGLGGTPAILREIGNSPDGIVESNIDFRWWEDVMLFNGRQHIGYKYVDKPNIVEQQFSRAGGFMRRSRQGPFYSISDEYAGNLRNNYITQELQKGHFQKQLFILLGDIIHG